MKEAKLLEKQSKKQTRARKSKRTGSMPDVTADSLIPISSMLYMASGCSSSPYFEPLLQVNIDVFRVHCIYCYNSSGIFTSEAYRRVSSSKFKSLDEATDGLPADAAVDNTAEESPCNNKDSSK